MKRGQASFEYILLAGIALLFVMGGAMIFYNYSLKSNDDLSRSLVSKIGEQVVNSAEKVYYVGGDSWETIKFTLPGTVKKMYVPNPKELVILYESRGGLSEAIFFSDINMTTPYSDGNISAEPHSGLNIIKVTSYGNYVNITEVS
jgi:hypothetical protein